MCSWKRIRTYHVGMYVGTSIQVNLVSFGNSAMASRSFHII